MFDVITGTTKTVDEMNRGFESQGLTAEAERRVMREALRQGPDVWWQSLGGVLDHSAFDRLSEWRERKILGWLSEAPGPARFEGLASMQGLARHPFQTIDPSLAARLSQMLRRLRAPN
eukprot:CAMPEP_0173468840 /NCGR_PEP_ID=MMETSP1357-20121228/77054_1 /TAXON_ID=77926 /ORGANISM="Hemiselmis rufescens, Strain PCC563" /LENGTH=117 /DNA_ID=CAMNT_0014437063 /DNA_START=511 /DNA_END=864 /DNA_ORIENTATION=-